MIQMREKRVKLERQNSVPVSENLLPTERRICAGISHFEDGGVMISVTQLNTICCY